MGTKHAVINRWFALACVGAALGQVVLALRPGGTLSDWLSAALLIGIAGNRWVAVLADRALAEATKLIDMQHQLILVQRETISDLNITIRKLTRSEPPRIELN